MKKKPTFLGNLAWGLRYGVAFAVLFSLLVGVLAILRGSDWNSTYQVSTLSVVLGYCIAGVLGGLLVGLLRPIATGRFGGTIVGMLTGAFVFSAIMIAADGIGGFRPGSTILPGTLMGGALGFQFGGEAGPS
jgi:hypothetical protein